MNDDSTPQYEPGAIVNGHRLGEDNQWHPVNNAPMVLPRPAGKSWFKRPLGIVGIVVGSLLLLSTCGAIAGASSGEKPKHEQAQAHKTPAPDEDKDGVPDSRDAFPADAGETTDENGNNVGDNAEAVAAEAKAKAKAAAEAKAKAAAEAKAKAAAAARKARAAARINNANAPSERQWAQIVKDPDAHTGEIYVVYAQITQFDSATGDDTFLADSANHNTMSYGYFTGENSMFTGKPRQLSPYVEDDVVMMTVEVDGSFSYDTQIGGNTTVPMLNVHKIARG